MFRITGDAESQKQKDESRRMKAEGWEWKDGSYMLNSEKDPKQRMVIFTVSKYTAGISNIANPRRG